MNEQSENFYLTKTPIKKLLFKFSIPCVLGMLVNALYNIVDQIFIGNSSAGTAGIMATTLVFPFTVVALSLALLIGDGCAALFSISLGSKDEKTSKKCVGNSIIASVVLSIILVILGFALMNPLFKLLGVNGYDANCQLFTKQYYTIILCGIPFFIFSAGMSSVIRAVGSPAYSMVCTVVGCIINIIVDPIFIFALGLGIKGAALATILGQFVSALMCVIYFRKPKLVKLNKDSFKIDGKVLKRTMQLGVSSFVTQISVAIISIVANNVVGAIGGENATDAGGALGIVFKVFGIVIAFCIGVSVGGQPIIGFNYGAKKYKRVLEAYKIIVIANIIIGIVATLLFEFAPLLFVNLFGGNANNVEFYREYAQLAFRIYLGGVLLCCIQKASCVFLQSIDRPYKAMILSLMRDVIVLVPAVSLLGLLGNLYTMLWAGPIADVLTFILTIILVAIECKKISELAKEEIKDNTVTINSEEKTNFVISIGREFGSGGKYIGEELAKRFNIKCYDNEILTKVSENYDIDIETLNEVDEKQKSSFWYSFATNYVFGKNGEISPISANDSLFLKETKVIEELCDKESCVVIGRCSDFILKNRPNVITAFIYAKDMNFKINRKKELENISIAKATKKIKQIDKQRAEYYKYFTSQTWGDKNNYEISIDSSKLGVEDTIDVLENYIRKRLNQ